MTCWIKLTKKYLPFCDDSSGGTDDGDIETWLKQQNVGCSEDAVAIIFPDTISLHFTISEEADELQHETCVLLQNSSVYPGILNERHDPTTLSFSLSDMSHLFQHCRNWMNTCLHFVYVSGISHFCLTPIIYCQLLTNI